MRVVRNVRPLVFTEEHHEIHVCHANRGEPYREGVELSFVNDMYSECTRVLLDRFDVKQLRDKLNEFLGEAE